MALAELCIPNGVGFTGEPILPRRWDAALFGEGQSRIVVAVSPDLWPRLQQMAAASETPLMRLGVTGGAAGSPGAICWTCRCKTLATLGVTGWSRR